MALKYYNPITPSQRGLVLVNKEKIWKGKPFKALTYGLTKTGGRNNHGHITVRHQGGGHKRKYRIVDFKRRNDNEVATVQRLEYDPNRNAFLAFLRYEGGECSYIIAPEKLNEGDKIVSGEQVAIEIGNCMALKNIPLGSFVHNIELYPSAGGQLCRSAGCYAQLMSFNNNYVQLKLKSGEIRLIQLDCRATIGIVSNSDHQNIVYAKAGRKRWLGVRPTVRGVAMNPVDHPHGGGEGKTSGGRHPVSKWGKCAKGKRTGKKTNSAYVIKYRYE